jgi:hypothetical protein
MTALVSYHVPENLIIPATIQGLSVTVIEVTISRGTKYRWSGLPGISWEVSSLRCTDKVQGLTDKTVENNDQCKQSNREPS